MEHKPKIYKSQSLLRVMDLSILEDLGLTPAEIKVYIALLEVGASSAGNILEKSRLQNSVVHRALNSLIEKGLISYIMEGRRKIYQATDPDNFYTFIEDKKKRFEQILPQLKQKQEMTKDPSEGTIFKGRRGINEIYQTLLNSRGKEYITYGGGERVTYSIMGEAWWKNLHTKRIELNIPSRQVFDETIRDFGEELRKRPLSKVKFLTADFEQLTETIVIGDYVAIVIFTKEPYGMLIKDPVVVDSYKKNFEILWKKAKV